MTRTAQDAPARVGFPGALAVPAVLAALLVVAPIAFIALLADPGALPGALAAPETLAVLAASAAFAGVATALCLLVGLPLAVVIGRSPRVVAGFLRVLAALPLVVPPFVVGAGIASAASGGGPVAGALRAFLPEQMLAPAGVVLAQSVVALPFLVLVAERALSGGPAFERAAGQLGAGRWATLWRVTLPLARGGIVAGVLLCFARAFGEFAATAFIAPGEQTAPLLAVSSLAAGDPAVAVALGGVFVLVALAAVLGARAWRTGSDR
ncbi:molybdate ABC transporter permease subunit [Microbacterium sp. gxy059]|uniref:molybdate ABC transporter permease subunit n=1 Tax=Microbacterium sp. gxy059 TaxID=2957199 RepID=UPI003D9818B0